MKVKIRMFLGWFNYLNDLGPFLDIHDWNIHVPGCGWTLLLDICLTLLTKSFLYAKLTTKCKIIFQINLTFSRLYDLFSSFLELTY